MTTNKYNVGEKVYIDIDDFGFIQKGEITKVITDNNGISYLVDLKDVCGYSVNCFDTQFSEDSITTSKEELLFKVLDKKIKFFLMNECNQDNNENKQVKNFAQSIKDCMRHWKDNTEK